MSGHSKWSTIKRQKGAKDMKRGQVFTKLSKSITIAVRAGGGVIDPDSNFRLRLAMDEARAANMPKENIERAIKRAQSKQEGSIEEAVYEGFGPGGFSVVVEALTDNKQRTISEVKSAFDKNGGRPGKQGSVLYQFEKKGIIIVAGKESYDEVFQAALDANAEDVEEAEGEMIIYTKPEDLAAVRDKLISSSINILETRLAWNPVVLIPINDKKMAQTALEFVERLENLDDVHQVYTNFDIPDETE